VSWGLKSAFEVDDERMIDSFKDRFLALNMLYLLQSYYFALLQALQSQWERLLWVVSMLDQSDSTKGARA